jgi:hypothetical protein
MQVLGHVVPLRKFAVRGCAFSTQSMSMPSKAFPSYTIYGHTGALAFKPQSPQFNVHQSSGGIAVSQKGRMVLEIAPRNKLSSPPRTLNTTNSNVTQHLWKEAIRYSLSVEDVGLILNALPHQEVELSSIDDDATGYDQGVPIDRVLKLSPNSAGTSIMVSMDFMQNGASMVQMPSHLIKYGRPAHFPLQVEMQAGEWIVVKTLLQHALPFLLGWTDLLALNNANAIHMSKIPVQERRMTSSYKQQKPSSTSFFDDNLPTSAGRTAPGRLSFSDDFFDDDSTSERR